ncbi:hypothetical protein PENSPDRAFT_658546 [Peniophora sp. CONT]|nr:hypothetical protein PENSPDRAFT_658546 [Peniophora sp. CONT]
MNEEEAAVLKATIDRVEKLSEKAHTKALSTKTTPNRLFALLIGVDKYQSDQYRNLRGAVKDAENVKAFLLKQQPPVSADRIRFLTNKDATSANIIKSIESIGREKAIRRGDPILIYYAGHGSNIPKPNGWPTASPHIQCLAPHDARVENGIVEGVISDRAFGALLKKLADLKGNKITVILDCCHSGSGTRDNDFASIPRGIEFKNKDDPSIEYTIRASYQQELWGDEREEPVEEKRGIAHLAAFANSGLRSHVLLAACSPDQSAYEDCGTREGRFTSALLHELETAGMDTLTYSELIRRLDKLPSQTPQCEGRDKDKRIIFDAGLVQRNRDCFPVRKSALSYTLRAGHNAGLKERDVFAIYRDREAYASGASSLCQLVVDAVGVDKSSVSPANRANLAILDGEPNAVAVPSQATDITERGRTCYDIIKSMYTLRAGQVHGVSEGDVFSVYGDNTAYYSGSTPSGKLIVDSVKAVTSSMSPFEGSDLSVLDSAPDPVAVLARVGIVNVFRVHVDTKKHPELRDLVAQALAKEALHSINRFESSITLSSTETASISIVPAPSNTVDFRILDKRVLGLGLSKLSGTVLRDVQSLRAALRSAAHFFYHLGSSPAANKQGLRDAVSMCLWETVSDVDFSGGIPMPVYQRVTKAFDSRTSGSFHPKVTERGQGDTSVAYGVDVVNVSPKGGFDLFVWLFYFDCSTLEIAPFYGPPDVEDGTANAPLRIGVKEAVPLNYGDAGSTPFEFELPPGRKRDVGFLRLFISTHYADLSIIAQEPVVEPGRAGHRVEPTNKSSLQVWDAITLAVVLSKE